MSANVLPALCLLLFGLFIPTKTQSDVHPRVFRIEPRIGSLAGGTRLLIYGEGFSTGVNLNADPGQSNLGNRAYLKSDKETVECDVENSASSQILIVCYTRPMVVYTYYYIQVAVDGVFVPFEQNCYNNPRSSSCRFYPHWDRTPTITSCQVETTHGNLVPQLSHAPGGLVTCTGRIYTAIYGNNTQTNQNGRTTSFRRVYVGAQTCELLKEPDVLYDLRMTGSNDGTFTCKTQGTFVGYQNISYILTGEYGRSNRDKSIMRVSGRDAIYNIQTYAEITEIIPQTGSLEGRTRIVIHGHNFDDTNMPVEVMVGGVPCGVVEGTLTQSRIECVTGKPGEPRDFYPGSRGIKMEIWNETSINVDSILTLETNMSNYDGPRWLDSSAFDWGSTKTNFAAKFKGVFIAPETDRYQFIATRRYGSYSLFISCDGTKKSLANYAWGTSLRLQKEQFCYLVVAFRDYSWTTAAHIRIGVYRATTTLTNAQSNDVRNEIQTVDFSAALRREKQNIKFTNWQPRVGVAEVQQVTIRHSCIGIGACYNVGYRLNFHGVKTLFIRADASDVDVRDALNNIFALSDEDLLVTSNETMGQKIYRVEFLNKTGDYSTFQYEKYPPGVPNLFLEITEMQKGESERRSFKLHFADRITGTIPERPSANDIWTVLEATKYSHCPPFLLPNATSSKVVFTDDYEISQRRPSNNRREDVEAFCGKFSLMNPNYVYDAYHYYYFLNNNYYYYYYYDYGHLRFDAMEHNWMCFAHRGLLGENVYLHEQFKSEERNYDVSNNYPHSLTTHEAEWRYSCLDLIEVISTRTDISLANEVEMYRIRFYQFDPVHNFYIDSFTIGSEKVTDDLDGVLGVRTTPAHANGETINWVSVSQKHEDPLSFDIEVDTRNCGHMIPLTTLAYTSISETNPDNVTQREVDWNDTVSFMVTRLVSGVEPMTGRFDLTVNLTDDESYVVRDIPVEISNEEFEERLESEVPGFGEARVYRQGSCHARDYRIDWLSNGGDKPNLMQVHMEDVDGASDIVAQVRTTQDGGVLHDPITGDMLRIAYEQPQVEVFINGLPSKCSGDCQFITSASQTPIISGISPVIGSSHLATEITITGTKFSPLSGFESAVKIGETNCTILNQTDDRITCSVGDGPLGTYNLTLNIGGRGDARRETENVTVAFTISGGVYSISPEAGFNTGGTNVTIAGYGFSAETTFNFGGSRCIVQSVTPTAVICTAPEASSGVANITISAQDGDESLGTLGYEYTIPDAVISSISPTSSTLTGGTNLTILGTNLGADKEHIQIFLGTNHECAITDWSATRIVCIFPRLSTGQYLLHVVIKGSGYADTKTNNIPMIEYILHVTDVSPTKGSFNGGTVVTITGEGFTNEETTKVVFGDTDCTVLTINFSTVECVLGRLTKSHLVTNDGIHPTQGKGFAWYPIALVVGAGDTVTWRWNIDGAPWTSYGATVFTTISSNSDQYDEVGFRSGTTRSQTGAFSYTFWEEGLYHVSSGPMDGNVWHGVVMRGSVKVIPAEPARNELSLKVGGYEAKYSKTNSTGDKDDCSGVVTSVPGCTASRMADDPTNFAFVTDICYTPSITSIYPTQGTMNQTITIQGKGFGTENCANKVIVAAGYADEYNCLVISSNSSTLQCIPDPTSSTRINIAFHLKVNVVSMGDTSSLITLDSSRRFTLLPSISSVNPNNGSLAGGTLINITGAGFSSVTGGMAVRVGGYSCNIHSTIYYFVQCLTPVSASEATRDVVVTIDGQTAECTGACQFQYRSDSTPIVTSWGPTTINAANTELTFEGSAFSSDVGETHIMLGDYNCPVITSNSTLIKCNIEGLPAGNHPISVTIDNKGYADLQNVSNQIYSAPTLTSASPYEGSTAGGTVVTFYGNGFSAGNLQVRIGYGYCAILEETVTNFQFQCTTPAMSGTHSLSVHGGWFVHYSGSFSFRQDLTPVLISISPVQGEAGDIITITGTLLDPDNMTILVGQSECLNPTGNETLVTCVLGDHSGGIFPVSAKVTPSWLAQSNLLFDYLFEIISVTPSRGSFAGRNLLNISGRGFGNNTEVYICNTTCKHGDEYDGTSVEERNIICLASSTGLLDAANVTCNITIIVDGQTVVGEDLYTFAMDVTPVVTNIVPRRGGTQGGTSVVITGTRFDTDHSKVSVSIGGVPCNVSSSNESHIHCTTEARGKSINAKLEVTISGKGAAANDDVEFQYVDLWSSRWTWGGRDPPVAGDFVVVPSDQTLVIDIDTPVLKMLLIQGGTVIFDEADIHLETENILITDGGVLQIGSDEEPFEHKAVITLHGHLRSRELPIYGTKGIGVRNGSLELHGKHVPVTWTLLRSTVMKGSDTLHLQHAVTWKPGEEIVIATTGNRQSQRETETAVIKNVSADGLTLTLQEGLKWTHVSAIEEFDEVTLETHAEVGLLTRNIVVEGSKHLDWASEIIPACEAGFDPGEFAIQTCFRGRFGEEEGSDQFGAQITISPRSPELGVAHVRMEYVELRQMGQAFRLGRYAIYFNSLGDVQWKSYVRGCAIHQSFNRAITIQNTHHLLVERNVVYDIMGVAVLIQDGIEHGNKIQYNLVLFCKQSTSLENIDITPAGVLVANPNNTVQHNHVAGGTHFGFSYEILEHPKETSEDNNVCQQRLPVGRFENNTVHSQGWYGLWVSPTYIPKLSGSCWSNTPEVAELHSLLAWNCEKGVVLADIGAVKIINFIIAHNSRFGIEVKKVVDEEVNWGQVGTYNSYIIAHASGLKKDSITHTGLALPLTEGYEVHNTTFINFNESAISAIAVTSENGVCTHLCGGWEARFANITFENSPNKGRFRWEHEVVLNDVDGTLTGTDGPAMVTPYNPTLSEIACPLVNGFDIGNQPGVACNGSVKFHRVSWNDPSPSSLRGRQVTFRNDYGTSLIPYALQRLTHPSGWMATVKDGTSYQWAFRDAEHITDISYYAVFYDFLDDDCVIISHNLTQRRVRFRVADNSTEAKQDQMVTCEDNANGDYYFDENSRVVSYVVSGRNRGSRKRRYIGKPATPNSVNRHIPFYVYPCAYPNCITPTIGPTFAPGSGCSLRPNDWIRWHSSDSWKRNGGGEYVASTGGDNSTSYPPDHQDVRIEAGTWVVIDQDFPRINKLWIDGVLELDGSDADLNFTLSATHIVVLGRLIVGCENASFNGTANIMLRGDESSAEIILSGGIKVGAKAIGVIGEIDLHGHDRDLISTHLASTLSAGDSMISVVDSPGSWVVGDEIMIATTSNDPWETETFEIIAVSGNNITLNDTAQFEHIAETFTYSHGSGEEMEYEIRAEVALLTRNIKIFGEANSFGARVLITRIGDTNGYGRIRNVEFSHTGQEGYTDSADPRYSLSFMNTGQHTEEDRSYAKRNTFRDNFNTAIGVFDATGIDVDENVIHHTIGPGIRVEATAVRLRNNLVMLAQAPSSYRQTSWMGAIEVNRAKSPLLSGNTVVGSEGAGYRVDGHRCSPYSRRVNDWGYNTARATLHGIWMNRDGYSSCTAISKFKIHSAYDSGVYYQGLGSVEISDVLVTDSSIAFLPLVYGPSSTFHAFWNKYILIENSTVVAVSRPGYCPTLDPSARYVVRSGQFRGPRRNANDALARTGMMFPSFSSYHNGAPNSLSSGSNSYPALGGRMDLRDVSFIHFGDQSCSSGHTVFMTNPNVEDFLHPISLERVNFSDSPEENRVFYHRPSVSKINPSDCVDMECDGMKNALLVDKDGSMLGTPGTVIPEAEYEWNGDLRRGLGDYRIPKTFLTALDGSRIPVDEIVPNKGIMRQNTTNSSCTPISAWRGYECHGYHHGIIIIENLDADTETRRISPVALVTDKYVDLLNGPQDHGWCSGITCRERLSTFWGIVAFEKTYEMHFTGTAPQKLRLRMLNEASSTKMVMKLFYTRPQRLDVYVDNQYVRPTNAVTRDGQDVLVPPSYDDPDGYKPTIKSGLGENYYERTTQTIYITLTGEKSVDIVEAPVLVISFNLPAVSPDEFFDNGRLIANLAAFLNIPLSKIRLVSAVREGSSSRRRREVGSFKATVEIGDPPQETLEVVEVPSNETDTDNSTNVTTTASPTVATGTMGTTAQSTVTLDLNAIAATLANNFQEKSLGDAIGTDVGSMAVSDPREPPVHNPNNTVTNETEVDTPQEFFIPDGLRIIQQPTTGNALAEFVPAIKVTGIDTSGNDIVLGHKDDQWEATVEILSGPAGAMLQGNRTIKFVGGIATFEGLTATIEGSYVLHVAVTYPAGQEDLNVTTSSITVERPLTTAPPVVTTPQPARPNCSKDCPNMPVAEWICDMMNWRCQMHEWMATFNATRDTCRLGDVAPTSTAVCPEEGIFDCCTGTKQCEVDMIGCKFCYCAGGKYKDPRRIREFWASERAFYSQAVNAHNSLVQQCTAREIEKCDTDEE